MRQRAMDFRNPFQHQAQSAPDRLQCTCDGVRIGRRGLLQFAPSLTIGAMTSSPATAVVRVAAQSIGDVRMPALRAGKETLRSSPAALS